MPLPNAGYSDKLKNWFKKTKYKAHSRKPLAVVPNYKKKAKIWKRSDIGTY